MGTTGVIFAAIAVAWLAYLVPHFVRRRDDDPLAEPDPADRFSDSIRVIRHGTAPLLDQDLAEIDDYEVSTPMTRRAALNDLRRLESLAALRRRRVLLILMAVLSVTIGVCAVGLIPWWAAAIPAGVLVVFFVVARVSVTMMSRSLNSRYVSIVRGCEEVTVLLSRKEAGMEVEVKESPPALPASAKGGLWDPIPITKPTYVSQPLAPRTVRTIDLSGPATTASAPLEPPVTADAKLAAEADESTSEATGDDSRRAASA